MKETMKHFVFIEASIGILNYKVLQTLTTHSHLLIF